MKKIRITGMALLLLLAASPVFGAEYRLWDFTSAAECDIGGASDWTKDNESAAPWTPSWDGNTHMHIDFATPSTPSQAARIRYNFPEPNIVTFATYPYLKIKLTVSGVPQGKRLILEYRVRTNVNGNNSPRVQVFKDLGDGTHIIPLDMTDPYNRTDYPEWGESSNPYLDYPRDIPIWNDQGTGYVYAPEIYTMYSIVFYFYFASATYNGVYDQATDVKVDIDWIALTDDCGYGGQDACPPAPSITSNITPGFIESGNHLILTAPQGYNYQWKLNGDDLTDPPEEITGINDRQLHFTPVLEDHEGVYAVSYTTGEGGKTEMVTPPFVLEVLPPGSVPAAGWVGMAILAAACGAFGVARARNKRN